MFQRSRFSWPVRFFFLLAVTAGLFLLRHQLVDFFESSCFMIHAVKRKIFFSVKDSHKKNEEISELKKKVALLEVKSLLYDHLLKKIKDGKQISLLFPSHTEFTYCSVISFNADAQTIVLSAGQNQGVKQGDLVVNGQGVVGRIETVASETARAVLLTHKNFFSPAKNQNQSKRFIVQGTGKNTLKITTQDLPCPPCEGEIFLLSDRPASSPWILGTFQKGYILPSVNFHILEDVYVIQEKSFSKP